MIRFVDFEFRSALIQTYFNRRFLFPKFSFRIAAKKKQASKNDLIPLHVGSEIMISPEELVKMFDTKPAVYTSKLAFWLFGDELYKPQASTEGEFDQLDATKLKSLIS